MTMPRRAANAGAAAAAEDGRFCGACERAGANRKKAGGRLPPAPPESICARLKSGQKSES